LLDQEEANGVERRRWMEIMSGRWTEPLKDGSPSSSGQKVHQQGALATFAHSESGQRKRERVL